MRATSCPIALALKDQGFLRPSVRRGEITFYAYVGFRNRKFTCETPPEGRSFIDMFDRDNTASPISLDIHPVLQ